MKRYFSSSNIRLFIEAVLLVVLAAVTLSGKFVKPASAVQSPSAPQALFWYVCNPVNHEAVFIERIHIYCQTTSPIGGAPALSASIAWFAFPTSPDSAAASRFMSMLQTAFITAKPIWLLVDPNDTSGPSFGCNTFDCRPIYGMEMR